MDETLLCLLKDYETAKEIPRHLEKLDTKVMRHLNDFVLSCVEDTFPLVEGTFLESGEVAFCKSEWISVDSEEWPVCFSVGLEDDEDEYDYWVNHILGLSRFPLSLYCAFGGMLDGSNKEAVRARLAEVTAALTAQGFSEVPNKSKKSFYFIKPLTFDTAAFIEAFENGALEDAFKPLEAAIKDLDAIVPLMAKAIKA